MIMAAGIIFRHGPSLGVGGGGYCQYCLTHLRAPRFWWVAGRDLLPRGGWLMTRGTGSGHAARRRRAATGRIIPAWPVKRMRLDYRE